MSSIFSYFREGYSPREVQTYVLSEVEKRWTEADVIVIRASVGAGKSLIADCIANWRRAVAGTNTTICTPTNVLVSQYKSEFPEMAEPVKRRQGMSDGQWQQARSDFSLSRVKVCNYYSYLAHRAYSPLVVFDESHNLLETLRQFDEVKLWHHQYFYPQTYNVLEILRWANSLKDDKRVAKLIDKLTSHPEQYVANIDYEEYRGEEMERLRIYPLTPRNTKPIFWPPSRVKKLILMSATIGEEDLYDLGLDRRRCTIIDGGSPIPAEQRPVIYDPVGNMSYRHQDANLSPLIKRLQKYMRDHEGHKGLIHVTYSLARKIRKAWPTSCPLRQRLIFHGRDNKHAALQQWLSLAPSSSAVLVGCGLTEGLDVKGDRGRWQAVCKILYPNKSDLAVSAKLSIRPQSYNWAAVRDLEQAVGRIVRSEDDWGRTYILDSAFSRLYNNNRHMFSASFKEALQ